MLYKDLSDKALDESIRSLQNLAYVGSEIRTPRLGKILRDLDIAVAVKRQRIRRGEWNPEAPVVDALVATLDRFSGGPANAAEAKEIRVALDNAVAALSPADRAEWDEILVGNEYFDGEEFFEAQALVKFLRVAA